MEKKTKNYIYYGWEHAKKNFSQYWLPLLVIFIVIIGTGFISSKYGTVYNTLGKKEYLKPLGRTMELLGGIFALFYSVGLVKLGLQANDKKKKFNLKTLLIHRGSEIWKSIISPLLFGFLMIIPIFLAGGVLLLGNLMLVSSIISRHPESIISQNLILQNPEITGMISFLGNNGVRLGSILTLIGLIVVFYLIYVGMRVGLVLKYVAIDHNNLGVWEMITYSRKITKGKVWKIFIWGFLAGLTNILGVLVLGIGLLWTIPLTMIAQARIYQDIDEEYSKKENLEVEKLS